MTTTLAVDRADLRRAKWLESAALPPEPGAVRLDIDRFALTSNSVTCGAFAEALHYWDFYPTGDAATGCIPVWGFATVRESRCAGIEAGERFYGYLPMADEVVLNPGRIGPRGLFDGTPRRRELASVYNEYLNCRTDPFYREADEELIALVRPLFVASFLIDDFLADNALFGADTVLISSASSKTAYGLAYCLAARRGGSAAPHVVGLTSPANVSFTGRLGRYAEVAEYEILPRLSADRPAIYVDMSGNARLRAAVHARWQDRLAYSCSVGSTHRQDPGSGRGLPGPRRVLFFAPAQAGQEARRRVGHGRARRATRRRLARVCRAGFGRSGALVAGGQGTGSRCSPIELRSAARRRRARPRGARSHGLRVDVTPPLNSRIRSPIWTTSLSRRAS